MIIVDTLVLVSDPYLWALRPFIHLWERYAASSPLMIAGFSPPDFRLPEWARFSSLGRFEDYPANRWSNAFREALQMEWVGDQFILLLEDFWVTRPVNVPAVNHLVDLARLHPDILRIDLTTDRLNATTTEGGPAAYDIGHYHGLDIIESKKNSPYLMSTMGGIWNRAALLDLLVPGETPWEFEIQGTTRAIESPYRVLGTRQFPLRHTIAIAKGRVDLTASWMVPASPVHPSDVRALNELGYLNGHQ